MQRIARAPGLAAATLALMLHALHIAAADGGRELWSAYPRSDAFIYMYAAWYRVFVDPSGGFTGQFVPDAPYLWVLEAAYRLLGPSPTTPLWANAVLMSGAVGFAAGATRYIFGPRAAWCAALLGAFCGPLVFFAGITVKTNIELPLIAGSLYLFARHVHTGEWLALFGAVLLGGLAALERNNIGFLPLLYVVAAILAGPLGERRKRAAGALLAAVAGLAIVVVASGWQFSQGEQRFMSPVGLNYYVGNAPGARGGYTPVDGLQDDVIGHFLNGQHVVSEWLGRPVSRAEVSRYWFKRSFDYYSQHPDEYLVLQLRKLALLFAAEAYGLPEQYGVWRGARPALQLAVVDGAVLLALALPGLWLAMRRRRSSLTVTTALAAAVYAGTIWIFFVGERYRLPLYILVLPFAGYGLGVLIAVRGGLLLRLAASVALLFAGAHALTLLNDHGPGWATNKAAQRAQEARQRTSLHTLYALQSKIPDELSSAGWVALSQRAQRWRFQPDAVVFARRAEALAPDDIEVLAQLAAALAAAGDYGGLSALAGRLSAIAPRNYRHAQALAALRLQVEQSLVELQR